MKDIITDFEEFIAHDFMTEYMGTKDQFDDHFDGYLENLDGEEWLELGNLFFDQKME